MECPCIQTQDAQLLVLVQVVHLDPTIAMKQSMATLAADSRRAARQRHTIMAILSIALVEGSMQPNGPTNTFESGSSREVPFPQALRVALQTSVSSVLQQPCSRDHAASIRTLTTIASSSIPTSAVHTQVTYTLNIRIAHNPMRACILRTSTHSTHASTLWETILKTLQTHIGRSILSRSIRCPIALRTR